MDFPEFPPVPRKLVSALGVDTSYYEAGQPDGRPVIMLHGMSTSADSFREAMHLLGKTNWVIAPDIPGFGYSGDIAPYTIAHLVEWLAGFVAALALPSVALVGHSFGGVLAAAFAASYPEDVTRLLLVAPALFSAESYPSLVKKVGISMGLVDLGSAVSQSRIWVKRQIKTPFFNSDVLPDSLWERRLHDYELARASADVLKTTAFFELRPYLAKLSHPIALVWGENDNVVPIRDGEALEQLLPRAKLHRFPQCGHAPMLEHPYQFHAIAFQFLTADLP
ncbi:MAG: alpha/beta hydrolase [Candidatus Promineifilaceae bacterium]